MISVIFDFLKNIKNTVFYKIKNIYVRIRFNKNNDNKHLRLNFLSLYIGVL